MYAASEGWKLIYVVAGSYCHDDDALRLLIVELPMDPCRLYGAGCAGNALE